LYINALNGPGHSNAHNSSRNPGKNSSAIASGWLSGYSLEQQASDKYPVDALNFTSVLISILATKMAIKSRRRWRPVQLLPWTLLLLPLLVDFWFTIRDPSWGTSCNQQLTYFGLGDHKCEHLHPVIFALGVFGTFGVIALAWWAISKFAGLMHIFEVPWFGLGEDVESVGMMESVIRAVIFVLFCWLCVMMIALAVIGARPDLLPLRTSVPTADGPKDGKTPEPRFGR
jgi:hypothetical protein